MKYKAVMQFAIHIPIENRSIDHNSFTDEDVDFLFTKWPNKYNHNFETVSAEVEIQSFPNDTPNDAWTVVQLKEYASVNGIKLGRAKSEASILNVINASNGDQ